MKPPKIEATQACSDLFDSLVKIKYWKHVNDTDEQKKMIKKYGKDKLDNGLTEEWVKWMDDFMELIRSSSFVDGNLF